MTQKVLKLHFFTHRVFFAELHLKNINKEQQKNNSPVIWPRSIVFFDVFRYSIVRRYVPDLFRYSNLPFIVFWLLIQLQRSDCKMAQWLLTHFSTYRGGKLNNLRTWQSADACQLNSDWRCEFENSLRLFQILKMKNCRQHNGAYAPVNDALPRA